MDHTYKFSLKAQESPTASDHQIPPPAHFRSCHLCTYRLALRSHETARGMHFALLRDRFPRQAVWRRVRQCQG